ncbi:hypothetical protein BSKO_01284 [Bryopsis sp. KO-2023]|nr:hypothetical protein BSKO_01284 [Bryopsis sp. KO-2023]
MMKVIRGDLIDLAIRGQFDVIIHGCNCFCTMGAGIAKSIKETFPGAYAADLNTAKGDRDKLGTFSSAAVKLDEHDLVVVNAYTQHRFGRSRGAAADMDAIQAVMRKVKTEFGGKRIGYPRIGAGLGRGNWETISAIIEEALAGEDHTLVEWDPGTNSRG